MSQNSDSPAGVIEKDLEACHEFTILDQTLSGRCCGTRNKTSLECNRIKETEIEEDGFYSCLKVKAIVDAENEAKCGMCSMEREMGRERGERGN